MPIEHINKTDTLNEGREKINEAIDGANAADVTSKAADTKATQALANSESTQTQLDTIVIDGDSSVEAAQARVDEKGDPHPTLKARIDDGFEKTNQQLAETVGRSVADVIHLVENYGTENEDWTIAIQTLLDTGRLHVLPAGRYRITDELTMGLSRTTLSGVGSSLVPTEVKDTTIFYDGPVDVKKAVLRVSTVPVGEVASVQLTNMKVENIVLDANNKAGYGLYTNYATNESIFYNITTINAILHNTMINKSWYATFKNITAAFGLGCGITFGRGFDGWAGSDRQVNSCLIENPRVFDNGKDLTFNPDNNIEWGYGLGMYSGYNSIVKNLTAERNDGFGFVMNNGSTLAGLDGAYFERNGQRQSVNGRDHALLYLGNSGGAGHFLGNIFLTGEQAHSNWQTIFLKGDRPRSPLLINNVFFGKLDSEWSNYKLDNAYFGLRDYITGHPPQSLTTVSYDYTTIYVRDDGDDNNTGRSPENAYKTLEKAIEMAEYGERVNTIDCTGASLLTSVLDFSKINKKITIDGGGSATLVNNTPHSGLEVINGSNVIIKNFENISRLISNNSKIMIENCSFRLSDSSATPCLNILDSIVQLTDVSMLGTNSNATVRNGIRSNNSTVGLIDVSLSSFDNVLALEKNGVINADRFMSSFNTIHFRDGSGYAIGGDRMVTIAGSVTFS